MGEDLADVAAATTEDDEERISKGARQEAAKQPAIRLHEAELGLDVAASAESFRLRRALATAGSVDQDLGLLDLEAIYAAVDERFGRR